jgi:hypothetical protein
LFLKDVYYSSEEKLCTYFLANVTVRYSGYCNLKQNFLNISINIFGYKATQDRDQEDRGLKPAPEQTAHTKKGLMEWLKW